MGELGVRARDARRRKWPPLYVRHACRASIDRVPSYTQEACLRFLANPSEGLVLLGPAGDGTKSYAASAVARTLAGSGCAVVLCDGNAMLDDLANPAVLDIAVWNATEAEVLVITSLELPPLSPSSDTLRTILETRLANDLPVMLTVDIPAPCWPHPRVAGATHLGQRTFSMLEQELRLVEVSGTGGIF